MIDWGWWRFKLRFLPGRLVCWWKHKHEWTGWGSWSGLGRNTAVSIAKRVGKETVIEQNICTRCGLLQEREVPIDEYNAKTAAMQALDTCHFLVGELTVSKREGGRDGIGWRVTNKATAHTFQGDEVHLTQHVLLTPDLAIEAVLEAH